MATGRSGRPARTGARRAVRVPTASLAALLLVLALVALARSLGGGGTADVAQTPGPASPARASASAAPSVPPSVSPSVSRSRATSAPDGLGTVAVARLPMEARRTLALIDAGGPFPYRQDGVVFGNRERLLPIHPNGWYHEYTVPTPGSSDRGARRLITGKDGTVYWTADHYASFRRVLR